MEVLCQPSLAQKMETEFLGWKRKRKKKTVRLEGNGFSSFEENLLVNETKATARIWKRWDFS